MEPISPAEAPIEQSLVRMAPANPGRVPVTSSSARRSRAAKNRPRYSVLVVDDDADVRELLAAVLKSEGYDVLTAENGAAALSVLRDTLPDLIVLDLMMPVMNGWEFRAAQLDDPALAGIPVMVVTADASTRTRAASLGVQAYMTKPIQFDRLLEFVGRHC
jgi:two-component system, chemotaxis family, chemotaxis protein CheY